jgi:hypothetical protein
MAMYRWADPPKTGTRSPTDAPIKKDDHAVDALRYLLFSYNEAAEAPPRIEGAGRRFKVGGSLYG